MDTSITSKRRIVIIGGGICGLAAAHRLIDIAPGVSVTLLESSDRLGGSLHTVLKNGFLLERGADSFLATAESPWATELCESLGYSDQLVPTNPSHRRAFVVHNSKLVVVPAGFQLLYPSRLSPILSSPLLSWKGKVRVCCEPFIRRRDASIDDEDLASFAKRRLGQEAFERLVQPLVGGIYTADPATLSMAAALPKFFQMERDHGSLYRAAKASKRIHDKSGGARYSQFLTPRQGLTHLVNHLASKIPPEVIQLSTPVQRIEQVEGGWTIHAKGPLDRKFFDAAVLCVPSHVAAVLVSESLPDLADVLGRIQYASSTVVCAGYHRTQVSHPLDGFGCIVPAREKRSILAISFSSKKFVGRAPADTVLFRVFLGGALQPELAGLDERELQRVVRRELCDLLQVRGEPIVWDISRWRRAMPQYELGHKRRVALIGQRCPPNLHLAGNAYDGVGIPHCIRSGWNAAEKSVSDC